MAGKFEVYKDKSGKFRWRLKAGNGEIVGRVPWCGVTRAGESPGVV
jgi:hypothetical protein